MSRLDRSIIAYAFLAQARRADDDLLSGLMPIFKPIAKTHEGRRFDPKEFSEIANDLYGLKISSWAVEGIIPRLEASGVLKKIQISSETHEYIYNEIKEQYEDVTEADVTNVLNRFVDFARDLIKDKEYNTLSDDDLKELFLQHIVDIDFVGTFLKPINKHGENNRPVIGLKKSVEQEQWEDDKDHRSRAEVLCASFIIDIHNKDKELYNLVERITAGALVSEVILNFQNPNTGISLDDLTIVLDTPFLMDTLDLASHDGSVISSSICSQLRENQAKLAVFRHSVDELRGNLEAVINAVNEGEGFGPTARRLADKTFYAYAVAAKSSPEPLLKLNNIEIIESDNISNIKYRYFTEDDEQSFYNSLGYYQNRIAQKRDAASIAAVVRLREGVKVKMRDFQACKVVFLTSNPWVADRSRAVLKSKNIYEEGDVPVTLTDRYIAGLLWVVYGGQSSNLPSQVLLANCATAVEPKADLIGRMHSFLSAVDEKQAAYFKVLMTEERAAQYLAQSTLGDSKYINQENAPQILEYIKSSLIEQHEIKIKKERESWNQEKEIQQKEYSNAQQNLQLKFLDAQAQLRSEKENTSLVQKQITNLEKLLEQQKKETDERINNQINQAKIFACKRKKIAHWLIVLLIFISGISFTYVSNSNATAHYKWIGIACGTILAILSFWKIPDLIFGKMIDFIKNKSFQMDLNRRGVQDYQIDDLDC